MAAERLRHRGPDGHGAYRDPFCELVHRRLALIDLSPTGHQPLANEDGSVLVIFNGELYNHRELRADLKSRGHTFRGTSDTEVLVHLYEERGARMATELRGMFAFAIYDSRRRSLLLARDRFGIKPLYYASLKDQFVFASEIKGILALKGSNWGIDRQACYDFIGLGYIPEPATGFSEIRALPRATIMRIDEDGSQLTRFHRIRAEPEAHGDIGEAVNATSVALEHAVSGQLVADVPVGALLSGGIDSSLVVAAACRTGSATPRTFNVQFPDAGYDETAVARAVSERYKTSHQTINMTEWPDFPATVTNLLEHFDQPFADTSLIPMFFVSKAIREQGIICALSGDGGDEGFGGYARFWRANRLVRLMRLPELVQNAAVFLGRQLKSVTKDFGRQLAKAVTLSQVGRSDSSALISGLSNYLSEEQKRELVLPNLHEQFAPVHRLFANDETAEAGSLEGLSRRLTETLFEVDLPSDMLRKVDMMSMLAGIEVRVPMLDEDVVDIGLQLPHRLKTDGERGKLVLRALAERWLPPKVVRHPKHGFGIPLDRLATDEFHDMLSDNLLSPTARIRGLLDLSVVQSWLNSFRAAGENRRNGNISREGLYQRIIIVLSLELWLKKNQLSW
jgi:asparagine synthase (glutamine-hydrolysing)